MQLIYVSNEDTPNSRGGYYAEAEISFVSLKDYIFNKFLPKLGSPPYLGLCCRTFDNKHFPTIDCDSRTQLDQALNDPAIGPDYSLFESSAGKYWLFLPPLPLDESLALMGRVAANDKKFHRFCMDQNLINVRGLIRPMKGRPQVLRRGSNEILKDFSGSIAAHFDSDLVKWLLSMQMFALGHIGSPAPPPGYVIDFPSDERWEEI